MDDFGNSQIGEIVQEVGTEAVRGVKKIGKAVTAQITGQQNPQAPTSDDIAAMAKTDDDASKREREEIKARMRAIYGQHAQRRKQEESMVKHQEKRVEGQKKEFVKGQKKQSADVVMAQTKANAEIKNMGAE